MTIVNALKVPLLLFILACMCTPCSVQAGKGNSIRRVETNQTSYINQTVTLIVDLDLSTYYNWGYRNCQKTHFAFQIEDGTGRAHVYGKKNRLAKTREKILKTGRPIRCKIQIVISPKRYNSDAGELMAELVQATPYRPQKKRPSGRIFRY